MPEPSANEEFISEPLTPLRGSGEAARAARGEPALPAAFTWRGQTCTVENILRKWKTSAPEGGHPGGERYLRRHWWTLRTTNGMTLTLYCLRQTRRGKPRWWLYTVDRQPPAVTTQ